MPPLKRSESAKTTLSMYAQRASKYQKWLGMVNVLLLLSSLVLLFTGIILRLNYFMDKLGFISVYFELLPVTMIVLGVLLFIVSALGFIFAGVESKPALFGYAIVMAIISLVQISTIFFIMETRTIIVNGNLIATGPDAINYYYDDPDGSFRREWDDMHQRLRCCGFNSYLDHLNYFGKNKTFHGVHQCMPDSCCVELNDDGICSRSGDLMGDCKSNTAFKNDRACEIVHPHGCLTILRTIYQRELKTQLLIFGLFDVFVVLAEIVSCALASAYVAQITRRQKNYYWNDPGAGGNTLRVDRPMVMSGIAGDEN